jgi:urease beta subunit
MKKRLLPIALLIAAAVPFVSQAQNLGEFYGRPSYWRPYDQRGINVFETSKTDSIPFEGPRVRLGAGFTQQFQSLKHETNSGKPLYRMGSNFNLAQANLFIDAQLADGIRLHVASYMSARHHEETWVKGGYIQFDKLPFKGKFWSDLMNLATIKVGHMEINYGDAHFRRTDGGQSLYNPFVENYIVDAFTTEVGGEVTLQKNGVFGLIGVTNGVLNPSVSAQAPDVTKDSTRSPSIYLKAGIDKNLGEKLRVRVTGSAYLNNKAQGAALYGGDRTGSNYWGVLEAPGYDPTASFTSGRFNPGFKRKIQAFQFSGFVKAGGFELFGNLETAKGSAYSTADPKDRTMNQTAVDALYRFGAKENVYVGARYNTVNSEMVGNPNKVKINRTAFAAGWFLTQSVLLKGEYVTQEYKNFLPTDVRNGGKFNGYVIEAVVGF